MTPRPGPVRANLRHRWWLVAIVGIMLAISLIIMNAHIASGADPTPAPTANLSSPFPRYEDLYTILPASQPVYITGGQTDALVPTLLGVLIGVNAALGVTWLVMRKRTAP